MVERIRQKPALASQFGAAIKAQRGSDRSYPSKVNHIHGAEAERLPDELTVVIRDLLDWATQQHTNDQSLEDGEAT